MANLLDYMSWRDDLTLRQSAFNEADGVILARLSYFPFDAIGLAESDALTVGAAASAFLAVPDMRERVLFRDDYPLMEKLAQSARFRDMELSGYRNVFDAEAQVQFCAITIKLSEDLYYVSFRGTDSTLVGWKENFNMAFTCPVPAQHLAVGYLEELAGRVSGSLILGGHSKGGNLAVYAGAFCGGRVQERVKAVYNFDGPGFDAKVMGTAGYERICERVHTLVPQSSVVGMLLEHEEEYTIVHSTQIGLLQHDVYSWEVERDHFVYLETVTDGSRFLDSTVKEWIAGMDYDRREAFVDAIYAVLSETNAKTLHELGENRAANAMTMLRSAMELDEPTRKILAETMSALMRCARDTLAQSMRNR